MTSINKKDKHMKKKIYLLFFLVLPSMILLPSCSKDSDDSYKSEVDSTNKRAEYSSVVSKIAQTEAKIARLQAEAKNTTGGRFNIMQEQISREIDYLNTLKQKKRALEKELGL